MTAQMQINENSMTEPSLAERIEAEIQALRRAYGGSPCLIAGEMVPARLEAIVADMRAEHVAELWSCPDCAFAYDARHVLPDGSHSCPVCSEERLKLRLAEWF